MNFTAIMKRSDGSILLKSATGHQIPMTPLQLEELLGYDEAKLQIQAAQTRLNQWHSLAPSRRQEALVKPNDPGDWNSLAGDEV